MKSIKFITFLAVLLASVFSLNGQEFREVANGIEYAEYRTEISGIDVSLNLLLIDPTKVRIEIVHARDRAIGTETVSEIAKKHGAYAAINAGFFRLDSSEFAGEAAALLMIDERLVSENEKNRTSIGVRNEGGRAIVEIGVLNTKTELKVGRRSFEDVGLNRECRANEIVVYTPELGAEIEFDGTVYLVKSGILEQRKDRIPRIGENHLAIVGCGETALELARAFEKSKYVTLETKFSSDSELMRDRMLRSEDIVAGVPRLVRNGKVDITWKEEKTSIEFVERRHPRTAIAILKNEKILLVTVDGRSEKSGGINLLDLANFLVSLGAIDALNLDGGGSTTMYIDGRIVNQPSDKQGERKVSDAILIFPSDKN